MKNECHIARDFKKNLSIRRFLYWVMVSLFICMAPVILLFSLGYKFDTHIKGFVRTGILSVKSSPDGATVSVNKKIKLETTPMSIRYVLPDTYTIRIEKQGYHPYTIASIVEASKVSEVTAVLIPIILGGEILGREFEVYSHFLSKKILGQKVILFTSTGIYGADEKLTEMKQLSLSVLPKDEGQSLQGILEINEYLIFWSNHTIYTLVIPRDDTRLYQSEQIYHTDTALHSVYVGIKDRYLITHEGNQIIAVDIMNKLNIITLVNLKSDQARVVYDEQQELLFFTDYDSKKDRMDLFTQELRTTFLTKSEGLINDYNKIKKNI